MCTIDREIFDLLKTSLENCLKKLEKLDTLEKYYEKSNNENSSEDQNSVDNSCEKTENVKSSDERTFEKEEVRRASDFECTSGENEQNEIDQKATLKSKKLKFLKSTDPKVLIEYASEVVLFKSELEAEKVYRRKKKYKWDDGG